MSPHRNEYDESVPEATPEAVNDKDESDPRNRPEEEQADSAAETASARGRRNRDTGERGEAQAAQFLNKLWNEDIINQHVPEGTPHNNDVETLDGNNKLNAYEVKTSEGDRAPSRPRTSKDGEGRHQGDPDYVRDRMTKGGAATVESPEQVGDDPDQVGSRILYSNERDGTFTVWRVGENGLPEADPEYIYNLNDIQGLEGGAEKDNSHDRRDRAPEEEDHR